MLEKKNIHPNVDFPCGMTYFVMGIPVPQYTPIFVASRITGWCAHIMEQHNRLIRPLASTRASRNGTWPSPGSCSTHDGGPVTSGRWPARLRVLLAVDLQ